jgi:hypothetical protein
LHAADGGCATGGVEAPHGAKAEARAFDIVPHTGRADAVHHADHQRLLQLVVGGAHRRRARPPSAAASKRAPSSAAPRQRLGAAGAFDGLGQHLHHHLHAQVHVVVARIGEAAAEGGVEGVGSRRRLRWGATRPPRSTGPTPASPMAAGAPSALP